MREWGRNEYALNFTIESNWTALPTALDHNVIKGGAGAGASALLFPMTSLYVAITIAMAK